MTSGARRFRCALLLVVLAVLPGCVRFTTNLSLNADGRVSGEVVVGASEEMLTAAGQDIETFQQELLDVQRRFGLPFERAEGSAYRAEGFVGARFVFTDAPASAFQDGETDAITEGPDGSWEVRFTLDDRDLLTDARDLGLATDAAQIRWQIKFPYEVVSHNGRLLDPGTVVWEPDLSSSSVVVFRARTNATPVAEAGGGGLDGRWAVGGGAVALVVIAAGGWWLSRRQRSDREGPSKPPTSSRPATPELFDQADT